MKQGMDAYRTTLQQLLINASKDMADVLSTMPPNKHPEREEAYGRFLKLTKLCQALRDTMLDLA